MKLSRLLVTLVMVLPQVAGAAAEESESQQYARMQLMAMANHLAGLERFAVSLRAAYDVVQENGQKIEFGEIRNVAVARPGRARIEEVASHGGRDLMLFDGQMITVLDGDTGLYAQAPQPGDIDTTIAYFVRGLKMRLPLAPVFMTRFPQELERRVDSIEYVETTDILGVPAHHVAGRTDSVDFQVWIADGESPWPLRIVMTYPMAEGQPQFRADLSDWDPEPDFAESTFVFEPAADAQQILFATQFVAAPAEEQASGGNR